MKMKKTVLGLSLASMMALFAVSCGGNGGNGGGKESTPEEVVVSFVTNGGTKVNTQYLDYGDTISDVKTTKRRHNLEGWYTDEALTNKFDESKGVKADTTLYAKWEMDEALYGDNKTTVFLAGDSTVKTYKDEQYIGGWGQFLDLYLDDSVAVANAAQGGRSSRSFINEGRLYNTNENDYKYTFSENAGHSIEDCIEEGDYLFIQFGHNDDDTKMESSYATLYDRMVPLGEPDANGIYPTTEGEKVESTHLPTLYTKNVNDTTKKSALTETAKYGENYYSYDCGGTYKWFLKQYIDFAREMHATPVLVTPVARVGFNEDGTLKSGAGLHGQDFAYVKAVRQLAEEEDCLLIDLFDHSKNMLETATKNNSDYLMALKPNDLTGTWPLGYDQAYKNSLKGYTGIEGTHYNKYGAFLEAAYVAGEIKTSKETGNGGSESFGIADKVTTNPKSYIDAPNLLTKSVAASLEALVKNVNAVNPNKTYPLASTVVAAINGLTAVDDITNDNYLTVKAAADAVRAQYIGLNVDDRPSVSNYDTLVAVEEKVAALIKANRPKAIKTVTFKADDATEASTTSSMVVGDFKVVGTTAKVAEIKTAAASVIINDEPVDYAKYVKFSTAYTNGNYIEFNVTGACTITVVGKSSGDPRIFGLYNTTDAAAIGTCDAGSSVAANSIEYDGGAGTLRVASTSGGVYIYSIIIEYFA